MPALITWTERYASCVWSPQVTRLVCDPDESVLDQ
jgi:hypothetical protein